MGSIFLKFISVKHFVVSQSIGSGEAEVVADATSQYDITGENVHWSIQLPDGLAYGVYVHYTVRGKDGAGNLGDESNIVSLYSPASTGLSTTAWVFIGLAIALLLIIIACLLALWLCPTRVKSIRRRASPTKKNDETVKVAEWNNGWRQEPVETQNSAPTEKHYFGQDDIDSIKSSLDERLSFHA